jgi:DNA end-binding protein Ku
MAEDLIGAYTSDFEPDRYKDTYRERLLAIVEQKRDGKTTKAAEPEAAPPAPDLVAALTASLEVARKEREAGKKATGKADGKSDGKANGKTGGGRSRAKAGSARSKSA